MEIYLLEYYEEIEIEDLYSKKYNLIGIYLSENDAQMAKENVIFKMKINENHIFISSTYTDKLQWEGGFVTD